MNQQFKLQRNYERIKIQDMIEKAGTSGKYQLTIFILFFAVWFCAAFIQMGFPIIFQNASFDCEEGLNCTQTTACANNYPLSDSVKSVPYTFNLTCDRKGLINIVFDAFLYGGFIGSLYYGQVIQRKGRKYGALQSLTVMCLGILLSIVSASFLFKNLILFSIGIFFFNFGFRGFYNASLLCLTEVANQISRASVPMFLSIGWGFGQIFIAIFALGTNNWKTIFWISIIPLAVLIWFINKNLLQSPRFCVIKHQFSEAKQIIKQISLKNNHTYRAQQLYQEVTYNQKVNAYREIMGGGNIDSRLRHHTYLSLFRYDSVRIRVFIVGAIWSIFSLSYFISANSLINPTRSLSFNIGIAGIVQISAYFLSILTSLHFGRISVISKLLIISGIIHICYFFIGPLNTYHGFSKIIVIIFDIGIRVTVSIGNTFLAIYAVQLFPTSIRHFALGMLGFITKLMYMLSLSFNDFWSYRYIHPNFILGLLMIGAFFSTNKLRQTTGKGLQDNLQEDGDGMMMDQLKVDLV